MALTPVLRVLLATSVQGGCTAAGLAVEDPHPDVQQEIWNDASRYDTAFKAGGMVR